jgi:tripartite ATP-independent transporter DctM subunit
MTSLGSEGEETRSSIPTSRLTRALRRTEDLALTVALAAMVLVPLVEILLRPTLKMGISAATTIVQHLTLVVGMLGAALAAREDRLLTLATGTLLPAGRPRTFARWLALSAGAAVAFFLFVAAFRFVASERERDQILAYGVPRWIIQSALALGFALVAVRLVRHAAPSLAGRAASLSLVGLLVLVAAWPPAPPASLVPEALLGLLVATVLGAPVFALLGGAALILFWGGDVPIASITVEHYRLVTSPTLPTVPLFTLAGYFLAEGGASRRLVAVFEALFGGLRGGPAIVTALVCAFFTTFTGASGVTILALGGLLMPILLGAGYSQKNALGLLTGAGSLGLLLPPCLPIILYAIIAKITMEEMFLGGILPGFLLVAATVGWGIWQSPRVEAERVDRPKPRALPALWEAKWELLLPAVALVALFGGFATPVEAAALTALYAFVIETWFYRDLHLSKDVPRVMTECGLLVGGVLLILGAALGFTNYLVDAEIPTRGVEWVTGAVESRLVFLLLLNLFLLVVGCLMDIFSAIVVVVPLIVPIGEAFGIDPVHLGIIFLANLELGYLTPPVGMNLFLSSYRFGKPVGEVARASFPLLIVMAVGVLVITYFPPLTTTLPRWFAP